MLKDLTGVVEHLLVIIMDMDERYRLSSENIEGFLVYIYVPKLNNK
jgi:hypothetical protein